MMKERALRRNALHKREEPANRLNSRFPSAILPSSALLELKALNTQIQYVEQSSSPYQKQIVWLQLITILWMCVEAAVAIFAALRAHSVALLAFGADSGIELVSAFVVLLRFKRVAHIDENLSARYYHDFPNQFDSQFVDEMSLTGAGGSSDLPAYYLDRVILSLGGACVHMRDVPVLIQPRGTPDDYYYGNLGQTAFGIFPSYTFDFRTMSFTIEGPGCD
jgi:hypothetical protein